MKATLIPSCFKLTLLFSLLSLVPSLASAHPANIPVARAKVQVDGHFDLEVTFDILAFVLDQTPQLVLDAPMNGLIDGSDSELQNRLNEAKKRFLQGLRIGEPANPGIVDSIDFPSAADIHQVVDGGQLPRLPVMMTTTLHCHLRPGIRTISFHFAEVMGTVVVTTEFPYIEPISESVDPGDDSVTHTLPTQAEVDSLAASMQPRTESAKKPTKAPTESEARKAIQKQYNSWSKAYMAHDVDTLLSILAPTYTLKTAQGKFIKHTEYAVMLKMRKQKHSDTTRYSTEILRITLKNGVAAIFSRETTTDPGLNQKTGKSEPVSYQHDYIDLWIYAAGKWLLQSTVTQREQLLSPTK